MSKFNKSKNITIDFSKEEFEYLADILEAEDIKVDSLEIDKNKSIKKLKKIINSIKKKIKNVENSSNYIFR